MLSLPNEMIVHILEYVDIKDIVAVLCTCRRIYDLRYHIVTVTSL